MTVPDIDTKDKRSLLLFFEDCAVNSGGRVNTRRMNSDDMELADTWQKAGFIDFGRICFEDIKRSVSKSTHWVHLSGDAMKIAHEIRAKRAERMWEKRRYTTTSEME